MLTVLARKKIIFKIYPDILNNSQKQRTFVVELRHLVANLENTVPQLQTTKAYVLRLTVPGSFFCHHESTFLYNASFYEHNYDI